MKSPIVSHTHLFNLSEDVWPFIQALNPAARQFELKENTRLSGHELVGLRAQYPGKPLQFVTPTPINPAFLDYVAGLIPGQSTVLTPPNHSGRLCHDVAQHKGLIKKINRSATLSAYCPSPLLYKLLDKLGSRAPKTIDVPTHTAWDQVSPFGTKTGLRQLIQSLNDPKIRMAPGKIFDDYGRALQAAAAYPPSQGVVLKTQKGHAGMGVAIFPPGTLTGDSKYRRKKLVEFLHQDGPYWTQFPLVVEAFIPTDQTKGGGIPNVEGFIDEKGQVHVRYHCGLYIHKDGTFAGTQTGPNILPPAIVDRLTYMANTIGQIYAQRGYRGVFELDTLAGQNGRLYVAESNIRRNGGTHTYNVASYFFGKDYPQTHHVITHIISLKTKLPTFDQILDKAQKLLFQPGGEQGVIPTDPDLLEQSQFGYMILSETKQKAHTLEQQFLRLLNSKTN